MAKIKAKADEVETEPKRKSAGAADGSSSKRIDHGIISEPDESHSGNVFVHLADLHLAPRPGSILKRDPKSGRLLRDLDRDAALERAVSVILEQDPLPSVAIVAGDIFDSYRGSPEAFMEIVSVIRRLLAAGVCVLGIAGNHDTPTNSLKTPMFKMLADVFSDDDRVVLAYDSVESAIVGGVEYVLLPHLCCADGTITIDTFAAASGASVEHRVLVVHGVAAGDPSLKQMDEAKEVPISKWIMDYGWDYIAFGHYHRPGWIHGYEGKAAYCGSLENTVVSGPDVCMRRGPVFVDLSADGEDKIEMHEIPIRPIIELSPIDLAGEDVAAAELMEMITDTISSNETSGAIVRLTVKGMTRSLYKSLPQRNFQDCDPSALLIRVAFEYVSEDVLGKSLDRSDSEDTAEEDAEDERGGNFLPLDAEVERAVRKLAANGTIPDGASERVEKIVKGLVA